MHNIRVHRVAGLDGNTLNRGGLIAAGEFAADGGQPTPHADTPVADVESVGMKELVMTAHARGIEERK